MMMMSASRKDLVCGITEHGEGGCAGATGGGPEVCNSFELWSYHCLICLNALV